MKNAAKFALHAILIVLLALAVMSMLSAITKASAAGSCCNQYRQGSQPTLYRDATTGELLPAVAMIEVRRHDGRRYAAQVNRLLLTVCTEDQYAQAQVWEAGCKETAPIDKKYCPILSYFRHCTPATPTQVAGKTPIKDGYMHVYHAQ